MSTSIEGVQRLIGMWADSTFDHTEEGIAKHLLREAVELCQAVGLRPSMIQAQVETQLRNDSGKQRDVAEEAADVLILDLTLAHHLGFDLADALASKHAINKRRTWGKPDIYGVTEHATSPR